MADHDTVTAEDDADHSIDGSVEDQEPDAPDEPPPVPLPSAKPKGGAVPLWQATARPGLPHPCWWHPLNLTTWTGAIGVGVAGLDPSTLALGVGTAVAGVLGMGVGAAVVDSSTDTTDRYAHPAGYLGGITGLGMGTWAWIASKTDLFNDLWQPAPWIGLGLGGVAFGAAYTAMRYRIAAARNPRSRIHHRNKTIKVGGTWETILHRAGFGATTVLSVEENWSGYTVYLRLDPDRTDTNKAVVAAKNKIVGIASRVLHEENDVALGDDDFTISATTNAVVVAVRVRLRNVLTSTIDPPEDTGPVGDPAEPITVGRWEDGEAITVAESGPHGCAIGATGSGKSTYEHGLFAQWSRRPHVLIWPAGLSKFETLLEPWMTPFVDGECARPIFDMIGGGSGGTPAEFWSATSVVAAGYMLMRHRQSSPTVPRQGGKVVISAAHPRVIIPLDEVDALTSYKIKHPKTGEAVRPRFGLPTGESLTVFEMMVALGSKGRSEGVELEVSTQRLTDKFWGVSVRDFISNVHRRATFFTMSRHDAAEMLKGTKLDSVNLRDNAMYMTVSADGKPMAGKACYYDAEAIAGYAVRADLDDTIGSLGMDEAAALGELYTARWNPERLGSLLEYFRADTSPTFRGFLETRATDGASPLPVTAGHDDSARPSTEGRPAMQALLDAARRAKQEQAARRAEKAGAGRPDPLSDQLDQLWQLPPVDDGQRNTQRTTGRSVVDDVLELFGDDETGHVATADLAERLGRVTADATEQQKLEATARLAKEISTVTGLSPAQRHNSARYDRRTRGFLLEELRRYRTL